MTLFTIQINTQLSEQQFSELRKDIKSMSEALDRLEREAEETKVAVREYIDRTNVLIEELRANANDPQRVNAVADKLDELQATLAPTPAPVEPAPEPTPAEVDGIENAPTE